MLVMGIFKNLIYLDSEKNVLLLELLLDLTAEL